MRFRIAKRTRSGSDFNPSLRMAEVLWVSTVFTLKSKTVAICLLLLPSASSWTTSRSREVRRSLGPDVTGAGPGLRKPPSTISDTRAREKRLMPGQGFDRRHELARGIGLKQITPRACR